MDVNEILDLLEYDGIEAEADGNTLIVEVEGYDPYEYEVDGDTLYRDGMECVTGDSKRAEAWIYDEVAGLYFDREALI